MWWSSAARGATSPRACPAASLRVRPAAELRRQLNPELVELEPLDDDDLEFLAGIITEHRDETESPVAAALLEQWETTQTQFAKVMPRDFKRVLAAAADAERDGRDVNEAIMEAARG